MAAIMASSENLQLTNPSLDLADAAPDGAASGLLPMADTATAAAAALGPSEIVMCDSCYNSAIELEAKFDEVATCDVCELRLQLAECQKQVAEKDARIAELEVQMESGRVQARTEEAPPPDARPHFMAISDGMFAKLRKYPYNLFLQIGRAPRSFWRTKATDGVDGMSKHLLSGLDHDRVAGCGFHTLWFGGLTDTTKEDYERTAYIEKVQGLLEKIRDHEKCLSVTWATLPETAFNAEAREINERMADWATKTPWIRILDLRYISRREGTMETKEAMWTPKGGQLVADSLKKLLSERLELTAAELQSMEASAKEMQVVKAKKQSQLDEQKLRKQQKLAKAALLKAGHPVPGSGAAAHSRRRGNSGKGKGLAPPPKKFTPSGGNGHKFANGAGGVQRGAQNSGAKHNRMASYNKALYGGHAAEYGGANSRLPASSNRVNPDYLDDQRSKRPRYSEADYTARASYERYAASSRFDSRGPAGVGAYGDLGLYSRRDDSYRNRSPSTRGYLASSLTSVETAVIYDRAYGGETPYPDGIRRQQEWENYERASRRY